MNNYFYCFFPVLDHSVTLESMSALTLPMRESAKLGHHFEMFEEDHLKDPERIVLRKSVLDEVTPNVHAQFLMLSSEYSEEKNGASLISFNVAVLVVAVVVVVVIIIVVVVCHLSTPQKPHISNKPEITRSGSKRGRA